MIDLLIQMINMKYQKNDQCLDETDRTDDTDDDTVWPPPRGVVMLLVTAHIQRLPPIVQSKKDVE